MRKQGRRVKAYRSPGYKLTRKDETLDQCDQIGLFLKGLGYKFTYKRSSKVWHLFGDWLSYFEKCTFYLKTDRGGYFSEMQ